MIILSGCSFKEGHPDTRPGKLPQTTMDNHHAINGKTHYFDWGHVQVRKLLVYQRASDF